MIDDKGFPTGSGGKERNSADDFFSKREIWEQVFGKDGRGGAIGALHDKVDTKFHELKVMIGAEFKTTGETMKSIQDEIHHINGVKDELEELKSTFSDHRQEWVGFISAVETDKAIQQRMLDEHQKGVEEGDRLFNKRMKLWSLYIGIVAIVVGAIVRIMFF